MELFECILPAVRCASWPISLALSSTSRGFLPPRWTSVQRTAIGTPTAGLIGYQTDSTENLYIKKSAGWKRILTEDDATGSGTSSQTYRDSTNLLLTSGSVSNSSGLSIDLSAFYQSFDIIEVQFYDVKPVTDGAIARIRLSADGTNYDAGANNYRFSFQYISSIASGISYGGLETYIPLTETGSGTDNASTSTLNGTVKLHSPNSSIIYPVVQATSNYFNNVGDYVSFFGGGSRANSQVTRGIQFSFSSGNISQASYKVYGRKNN